MEETGNQRMSASGEVAKLFIASCTAQQSGEIKLRESFPSKGKISFGAIIDTLSVSRLDS